VTGRLVPREELTASEREALFALLSAHFEGVTRDRFAADVAEKNWILLLEEDGRLRGFSTLRIYETHGPGGEPLTVLYSGDTIVEQGAWASAALPKSWIAAVRALRERHPRGRLLWLLLTSGFRTYRFLPVFWRDFWPRPGSETPPEDCALLDHLARERFGALFDAAAGVVRFPEPQVLRAGFDAIPAGRLADPYVAFFLAQNPGWAQGDELVCLTELAEANLTPAGRRMWRHGSVTLEAKPA
jgi:hypothetical protein